MEDVSDNMEDEWAAGVCVCSGLEVGGTHPDWLQFRTAGTENWDVLPKGTVGRRWC